MSQDHIILQFIKKVRRRLCRNVFVQTMLWALFAGMTAWGIFNFIALFVPFYAAVFYGFLAFIVCQVAGIIVAVRRYPSVKSTTLHIDSKGLKERVTTAYELSGKNDVCSQLQKRDTIEKINGMHIRKSFPLRIRKRMYFILFAALIFVVTTAMIPAKTKQEAKELHELEELIEEKEEILEEMAEKVEEEYNLTDEQIEALENLLNEALEELQDAGSQEDMAKVEERFETKLEEQFINPLENQKEAQAIENSLQNMMEGHEMTAEEQQAVTEQLQQLAENAESEYLNDLVEQMMEEIEQNGEMSPETAQQLQEYLQQYMQNQQGQVGVPQQGVQGPQGQITIPPQGQPGEQDGDGSGGGNGNSNNSGDGSGEGSGNGSGGGEGESEGKGSGTGTGWNEGSKYGQEMDGNSNGERVMIPDGNMESNENLTGQSNSSGTSYLTESEQTITWTGESVDYNQVIGEYTNQAYTGMESSNIPDSMKDLIRDYFTELNQ